MCIARTGYLPVHSFTLAQPFMLTAVLIISCALAAALAGTWLGVRRRAAGRVQAARVLCVALDDYAASLAAAHTQAPDADPLWHHLERAKAHMGSFPELADPMWELTKAHGELTTFLLHGHMERMGAHTTWPEPQNGDEPTFDALRDQALAAVHAVRQRCHSLNQGG